MHDFRIVAILLQHLFAEAEKIGRRETVVFQNSPFLLLFKEPVDSFRRSKAASQIFLLEQRLYLTGPVDSLPEECADLFCGGPVFRIPGAWSVRRDIESFRPVGADGFQHSPGLVRTVEHQHQN